MILPRWTRTTWLALLAATMSYSVASAAVTLDRDYRLGDLPAEGAAPGADVGSGNVNTATLDSAGNPGVGELPFLTPVNTPNYVAIAGRPDGGSGLGVEFVAGEQEYLHGPFLGFPEDSFSSGENSGTLDYAGVTDRGMQFWVRPASAAPAIIVTDTQAHGVRILANGNYAMTYAGFTLDSGVAATPGTWRHIEMVSAPSAFGHARLYIDGVARAVRTGPYPALTSDLVVGANTGGDDLNFTGGTAEFFSGVVDDLKMFVFGSSTSATPVNYGSFVLDPDNDYAAFALSGVPGDVNNVGGFNAADVTAFIAGWNFDNRVNGVRVGDMFSHSKGDLNFDGITDIHDLAIIQALLPAAGLPLINASQLSVPEPATPALAVVALAAGCRLVRRLRRHEHRA